MKRILYLLVFIASMAVRHDAWSVVYPDRYILLNPLANETGQQGLQFFPMFGGWGEGGHYIPIKEKNEEHTWSAKLGVAAEFFRKDNIYDFIVSSDIELTANPRSEITFNPRSFFWQETFMFTRGMKYAFWQTGFVHRCKHDIDNIEVQEVTGERRQTVLIYDSLFLRFIGRTIDIGVSGMLPFFLVPHVRFDMYVLKDDERIYDSGPDKKYSVENLKCSAQTGFYCDVVRLPDGFIYMHGGYMASWLSSGSDCFAVNTALCETGMSFTGIEGVLAFFIMLEYQQFTMINPFYEDALYVYMGVRVRDGRMYR